MNSNLILHMGGHKAERQQVAEALTPRPVGEWVPLPHIQLVEQVEKALDALHFKVVSEAHALSHQGQRYFGLLQVQNGQPAGQDFGYVLGLRNSHDKAFSAGLVVGSSVFVCDNLAFDGEIRIARKHTTYISRDLPVLTSGAVGKLSKRWLTMGERIEAYKKGELSDAQVHDFLIRSLDVGAATITQLPKILDEWRHPRHQAFVEAGKTAWRLFNAYTEIGKGVNLDVHSRRTTILHGLLDQEVRFIPKAGIEAPEVVDAEVVVEGEPGVVINN